MAPVCDYRARDSAAHLPRPVCHVPLHYAHIYLCLCLSVSTYTQEFRLQEEHEIALGLPVTVITAPPSSNQGMFINLLLMPYFTEIAHWTPAISAGGWLNTLQSNASKWAEMHEEAQAIEREKAEALAAQAELQQNILHEEQIQQQQQQQQQQAMNAT